MYSSLSVSARGFKKSDMSGLQLSYQIPAINRFSFRILKRKQSVNAMTSFKDTADQAVLGTSHKSH